MRALLTCKCVDCSKLRASSEMQSQATAEEEEGDTEGASAAAGAGTGGSAGGASGGGTFDFSNPNAPRNANGRAGADGGGDGTRGGVWPLPKFYFRVRAGSRVFSCQEVSGLDTEAQVLEYRAGTNNAFSKAKMPGMVTSSNVVCKKVKMSDNDGFWDWFSAIKMNVIKRESVKIELLGESGAPTMIWTLKNAWPAKVSGLDLKAEGNEVVIDSIEFVHEGFEVSQG